MRRTVKWEHLPKHPPPTAEELCAAMYDVLGQVWEFFEDDRAYHALTRRTHRYDWRLLKQEADAIAERAEYLVKRVYGDGWAEHFAEHFRPGKRKPLANPWEWQRGRRRRSPVSGRGAP